MKYWFTPIKPSFSWKLEVVRFPKLQSDRFFWMRLNYPKVGCKTYVNPGRYLKFRTSIKRCPSIYPSKIMVDQTWASIVPSLVRFAPMAVRACRPSGWGGRVRHEHTTIEHIASRRLLEIDLITWHIFKMPPSLGRGQGGEDINERDGGREMRSLQWFWN